MDAHTHTSFDPAREDTLRGGLPDLPPVQHTGERVLTTELLARVYGTEPNRLRENFDENRERFQEGVHFHKLRGDALRAFKNDIGNSDLVGAKASSLILWTERGAARHAKMLHTDAAWAVFGRLEEHYFASGAPAAPTALPSPRIAVSAFKAYASFGRYIGLDRNQAILAANQATRKAMGIDLLADMGQTHFLAPQQERLLTPSDIGKEIGGKSGMAVNAMLAEHGLQVGKRDAKDRGYWEPTEAGEPFAVWQDTSKRHGDGTPVRQLKWVASIIEELTTAA